MNYRDPFLIYAPWSVKRCTSADHRWIRNGNSGGKLRALCANCGVTAGREEMSAEELLRAPESEKGLIKMARRWIRLYTEIPDDPKVQSLNGNLFKFWINCLCLAGRAEGNLPDPISIAWTLRQDQKSVEKMLTQLIDLGLMETEANGFIPHEWNKRQYEYDVSTNRVKQFRERKRNVSSTVTETVSASVSVSGIKTKEKVAEKITNSEPLELAWSRHNKHSNREPMNVVFQMVFEKSIDFEKHSRYCEYWNKHGWPYSKLTFLGWVNAGQPDPPPEVSKVTPQPQGLAYLPYVDPLAGLTKGTSEKT